MNNKEPKSTDKRKKNVDEAVNVVAEVQSNEVSVPQQVVADGDIVASVEVNVETSVVVPSEVLPEAMELPVEAVEGIVEDKAVVVTKDGAVIVPEDIELSEVSKMPLIPVFDEAQGEVVTLTGEELVQKIKNSVQNGELFVAENKVADNILNVVPAQIEENVEREFNFAKAEMGTNIEAEMPLVEEVLVEQAKILDTKIGDDKKLKIEVSVDEESFSYADDINLVQDKIVLDEAVKSVLKDNVSDSKGAQLGGGSDNVLQNSPVRTSHVAPIGVAVAMNTVVDASVNSSVVASGVDGISSVSGTSGQALGGAVIANMEHKSEGLTKTFETGSKDIYKGMSKEVIEQVKVNITKSAVKGVDKIDIQLKPKELGSIEIKMQISKDGKLQAHIISGRAETMEILQREVQDLERAFNDAGFETDSGSFSFSFRGDESEKEQNRNAELRSFIGNVLEQDSEDVLGGNDNLQNWSSAQGLNIRV